ncbi:MAG: aldo/keto reductase, partial [Deltaproteobacteria bacterium]|nr:aldo/keto reductase [Nannocystaceae bacterium]
MTAPTSTVRLGRSGPELAPIALGCMGFSGMYGAGSDAQSIATIHAALEHGVGLLDTGDFYGMGHNEALVAKAIAGRRDRVLLSVKFGALRSPDGGWLGFDARPAAVKTWVTYSLQRLGVEVIDIYRPARLDAAVPIEDTIGAIAELVEAGYVRYIGLSEVGSETIRRAHAVHPITDLQIEYSVISRAPEQKIFPMLDELGIGATLYGVLSRGLLSGSKPSGATDFRAYLPRFAAEHRAENEAVVARFAAFAAARGQS